jgi:hypothetical protein
MWEKKFSKKNITADKLLDFAKQRCLICTLDSSLKSLGDNRHFHFKKAKEKGVLEVTLMYDEIILNIHQNRNAEWILAEVLVWRKTLLV